jgi:DNA polymerase-1
MRILAFDIETAAAEELHSYGHGFVRLCGWQWIGGPDAAGVMTSPDASGLIDAINAADALTAHNGLNFDLLALAKWNGLDYERAAVKMFDTLVTEKHLVPVAAKGAQANGFYQLGNTAERYGLDGKDTVDFAGKVEIYRRIKGDAYADKMLKNRAAALVKAVGRELDSDTDYVRYLASGDIERCHLIREATEARIAAKTQPAETSVLKILADVFGGFDKIPVDDPDYVSYLIKDVTAQAALFGAQRAAVAREDAASQRYLRREHYVSAAMGRVTLEGFRTDVDLTMKRWAEGQARLEEAKQRLHEQHGMPLEGAKPHTTNPGKAAFRAAILATGIREEALDSNWPLNKDGSLSTAKETLTRMIGVFEGRNTPAAELCRTILAMNGERTVYGTVLAHLVGDRVHPYIGPDQASGRWSMKDPGLTVLGKRGGKARERAMMVADEGDVLVAIDADQIDARMIAALSQDPEYMKLFVPGVDLHSEVAFRVWPDMGLHGADCHQVVKPGCECGVVRKCHCEYRDRAKVFGHGWNYGMGPNSMVRQHGVDIEVARQFDQGMQTGFRRLCDWKAEVREAAGAVGFDEPVPANDSYRILHTAFGRPVRVERQRAYTQATALVGQGSTRDGMAEAILKLPAAIRRRIRAIIHDEIVISIPAGPDAQERAQAIADSMAYEVHGVTISFGCSRVAKTWAGCYGAEYEV